MTFTLESFQALLPLLITCATTIFVMLAIAIKRNHWWNATVTVIGLNIALLSCYFALKVIPQTITPLFVVDGFSLFFAGLILIAALGATTLTNAYMESFKRNREEIYLLITIATAGGIVLSFSHHMASLFIGLEMMSVALYGMVAYTYDRARSLEAAIKYLVLSATASAVMLFGIALIYAQIGSLAFSEIGAGITQEPSLLIAVGGMLLVIGLFFKLSLAPFHLWTPDVYEGAPAPVGAFLATAAKVAVFAVLVRFAVLESRAVLASMPFVITLVAVSCISMLLGSLLALKQNNIKRMLGYSSISHFGYLLALVILGRDLSLEGFAVYLSVYVMTSLAAFGVVTLMSHADGKRDADTLNDYRGLFWRRPYLASIFTLALFSLAGIPLTAGFIAKFYVVAGVIGSNLWGFNVILFVAVLGSIVIASSISIFFYLRTIISLFLAKKHMHRFDAEINWGQRTGGIMVLGAAAFILVIGIVPTPLLVISQLANLFLGAP
jgi:NADH-quinone oxidoreductase subunit N